MTSINQIKQKYDFFHKITLQKNLFTPAPTFDRKIPFQSGKFIRNTWKEFLSSPSLPANISLYMHVPFCKNKRCRYCMYYSAILRKRNEFTSYISYLSEQADFFLEVFKKTKFTSSYIGGGTPSILNVTQLSKLLSIANRFSFKSNAEHTCEQSFHTTSCHKIDVLAGSGVNRLSFGLQSIEKKVLNAVDRAPVEINTINRLIKHAKNSGITEINIDLMIGLPGETTEGIKKGLQSAIDAGAHCITVYVFRHLKHHMENLRSNESFFTWYNADHIPKMLANLRKTAFMLGWIDTVMNDNSEFHFFTSKNHLNRYSLSGYLTRYDSEHQNSILGLGHSAFSFIMDFFRYECRDREMSFNPETISFVFDRISGDDRKRLFVLDHLNREGKINTNLFKASFGQDFRVSFEKELRELGLLKKICIKNDTFLFKTDDRIEFAALSKFFWPESYIIEETLS